MSVEPSATLGRWAYPLAASIVFLLGFADLIRGGITVSAILLTVAYCVLFPLAILRFPSRAEHPADVNVKPRAAKNAQPPLPAPSYMAAGIVALAILVLYLVTLAPTTVMWDASEYIAAAYVFGIPHPPGNPFFVIIGRVFAMLPIAADIGARVNILAAVCSAASAALWFLVAERVMAAWQLAKWQRIAGAAAAALIGATAFTVWNQSVANEKVYTVSLLGIAIISWLTVRWLENADGARADRILVFIAYLCGLGYANHMAGIMAAPAVAFAVVMYRPRLLTRWKLILACLAALIVGVSPFATQPIRAAYSPPINEGSPTACRNGLELSCTFSTGTYEAFKYNFDRKQYQKPPLSERQASFGEQVGMWWLYFRWQWMRDPHTASPGIQSGLAALFMMLGVVGMFVHWKHHRRSFTYFAPLMLIMTLGLVYYLNFKIGASQGGTLCDTNRDLCEVRDRDYFFLWSFSAWGVWAALGAVWMWESLAGIAAPRAARPQTASRLSPRAWLLASPVMLFACIPLVANARSAPRTNDYVTTAFARDLLNSVEPYGVLVVVGDNDTFPLWYAQEVEGVRKDVTVVITSLLGTDWYPRQLITRPVYEYDAARGPAVYRNREWKKPASSPMGLTMDEADSVPQYTELRAPAVFEVGELKTTIDPRKLEYGVMLRPDYFILRMIQHTWGERPFYFSRSSGPYPAQLGFGSYLLGQGLADKLFIPPDSAKAAGDTVHVDGLGWVDVRRSLTLWDDVFGGHDAAVAKGDWIDRPSESIPGMYAVLGAELGHVLMLTGDADRAQKVANKAIAVSNAIHLGNFAQQIRMLVPDASTQELRGRGR